MTLCSGQASYGVFTYLARSKLIASFTSSVGCVLDSRTAVKTMGHRSTGRAPFVTGNVLNIQLNALAANLSMFSARRSQGHAWRVVEWLTESLRRPLIAVRCEAWHRRRCFVHILHFVPRDCYLKSLSRVSHMLPSAGPWSVKKTVKPEIKGFSLPIPYDYP